MKTATIQLYDIDELEPDVRKHVLEEHRYFETEFWDWWEHVYDTWREKLEKQGFDGVEIQFSGFSSQGDGASFTAGVDILKFFKANKALKDFPTLVRLMRSNVIDIWAGVKRISSMYVHENTVRVESEYIIWENIRPGTKERFEKEVADLEVFLLQSVRALSKEIYRDLEDEYEYRTSDQCVVESLRANDFLFLKNGKAMYRGDYL